jgi:hypothetical protein
MSEGRTRLSGPGGGEFEPFSPVAVIEDMDAIRVEIG